MGLTYAEFWRELDKVYGKDVMERHRRDWDRLSIQHLTHLTVHDLRKFLAQFELAMARVGQVTEWEAARKFLGALPPSVKRKLTVKFYNDNKDNFGYGFPNHPL